VRPIEACGDELGAMPSPVMIRFVRTPRWRLGVPSLSPHEDD